MPEEELIRRLQSTLEARKKTYSCALARLALSPAAGTIYTMCFGRIDFLHRNDSGKIAEVDHDYGNFRLIRTVISLDHVSEILSPVLKEPRQPSYARIKDDIEIQIQLKSRGLTPPYIASYQRFSQIEPDWPSTIYASWDPDVQNKIPQSPTVRKGMPLYPDGNTAIAQFCSLRMGVGELPITGLVFVLPDFRARLRTLSIEEEKLSVEVEALEENIQNLQVKFYYESNVNAKSSSDLSLMNSHAEFKYEGDIEVALVHLLSIESGDDIDNRLFNRLGIESRGGVSFAPSPLWAKQLIAGGEGLHVEFKEAEKGHKELESVIETILAFSNASGGTIFVGVTDNGVIKGVFEEPRRYIEAVENSMGHKCVPRPSVQYSITEVDGKKIVILTASQGSAKPYHHVERGFFIRRDGTNLQAQREEVRELFRLQGN